MLESSRDAILHNGNRLASGLERRLESLQNSLDALLQGRVPVTLIGYFSALQGPAAAPTPAQPPPLAPGAASEPRMPVFTALAKAFTVKDVWREWREGFAGRPAVHELEEKWGSRWRPGNTVRVQFCRRKVIWDELLARVARGKSEDEAVAELELLCAGRGLNQLVDDLKRRRQHPPGAGARARGRRAVRGRGRRGR